MVVYCQAATITSKSYRKRIFNRGFAAQRERYRRGFDNYCLTSNYFLWNVRNATLFFHHYPFYRNMCSSHLEVSTSLSAVSTITPSCPLSTIQPNFSHLGRAFCWCQDSTSGRTHAFDYRTIWWVNTIKVRPDPWPIRFLFIFLVLHIYLKSKRVISTWLALLN